MVAVPSDAPNIAPVLALMVAIVGALLLQVPPVVESESMELYPTQAVLTPVIGPTIGSGFTVCVFVAVALPQLPDIV